MEHTLYLLRHAKSSWAEPSLPDHDRPLAPRGERACALIAEYLRRNEIRPELVLCSSATRTRDTLERIVSALGDTDVSVEDDLYGASASELLTRLRAIPDAVPSVLLIGHNPGIQELALDLTAASEAEFPTAALATLVVHEPWVNLASGGAELTAFVRPRDLDRQ